MISTVLILAGVAVAGTIIHEIVSRWLAKRGDAQLAFTNEGPFLRFAVWACFLTVGVGVGCAFFLGPLIGIVRARNWVAVPCVVASSKIETDYGGEDVTYRANVVYSYKYNRTEYQGGDYGFTRYFSSGYAGKQAILARYPPGSKTNCYVNPNFPMEAVLERGFTEEMWFGIIPLAFIVVGVAGLIQPLVRNRPPVSNLSTEQP